MHSKRCLKRGLTVFKKFVKRVTINRFNTFLKRFLRCLTRRSMLPPLTYCYNNNNNYYYYYYHYYRC